MKKVIICVLPFIVVITSFCFAQVYVKGYFRKDGTYVAPHYRTNPDSKITNNYSYPGNYNPNTGKITSGTTVTNSYSNNYTNTSTYTSIPQNNSPSNKVEAIIPNYQVNLDGTNISTYSSGWKPLVYNNIVYIPMTYHLASALHLRVKFDENNNCNLCPIEETPSAKESFLDNQIAIVSNNGTNLYHKYGCDDINLSSFWAFDVDSAVSNGFVKCSKCH